MSCYVEEFPEEKLELPFSPTSLLIYRLDPLAPSIVAMILIYVLSSFLLREITFSSALALPQCFPDLDAKISFLFP